MPTTMMMRLYDEIFHFFFLLFFFWSVFGAKLNEGIIDGNKKRLKWFSFLFAGFLAFLAADGILFFTHFVCLTDYNSHIHVACGQSGWVTIVVYNETQEEVKKYVFSAEITINCIIICGFVHSILRWLGGYTQRNVGIDRQSNAIESYVA